VATQLLSAQFTMGLTARYSNGLAFSPTIFAPQLSYSQKYVDGTVAGTGSGGVITTTGYGKFVWVASYALANGAPVTIDLTALTDTFGTVLTAAKLKAIMLSFPYDGVGTCPSVTIAPGAANGFFGSGTPFAAVTDFQRVMNGFTWGLGGDGPGNGYAVTGSKKTLLLTAETAGTANIQLTILGTE
jgi:hypothetical protein